MNYAKGYYDTQQQNVPLNKALTPWATDYAEGTLCWAAFSKRFILAINPLCHDAS